MYYLLWQGHNGLRGNTSRTGLSTVAPHRNRVQASDVANIPCRGGGDRQTCNPRPYKLRAFASPADPPRAMHCAPTMTVSSDSSAMSNIRLKILVLFLFFHSQSVMWEPFQCICTIDRPGAPGCRHQVSTPRCKIRRQFQPYKGDLNWIFFRRRCSCSGRSGGKL